MTETRNTGPYAGTITREQAISEALGVYETAHSPNLRRAADALLVRARAYLAATRIPDEQSDLRLDLAR